MNKIIILVMAIIVCVGCSPKEISKTIWGSSTRVLEKERAYALTQTYSKDYWETVRAVLKVIDKNHWEVFKRDEVHGSLIIMGIRGAVNTTEVGVFFVEESSTQTRVELSSLSSNAKEIVADRLFRRVEFELGSATPTEEEAKQMEEEHQRYITEQLEKEEQAAGK